LVIEHIPSEPKTPPIEANNDAEVFLSAEEQPPIEIVEPAPILETIDAPPERPMMQKPGGGGWVPIPPRLSLRPPGR
jgi:hypothetical protein